MTYNRSTITVKTPSIYRPHEAGVQTFFSYDEKTTKNKAIALEILLNDGYNKYGRHIDVDVVKTMKEDLDRIISNLMFELE